MRASTLSRLTPFGLLLFLLLIFALLVPAVATAERADERALREAREQIKQVERELGAARAAQRSAAAELREAEDKLARLEAAVNEAAAAVERQRLEIVDIAEEIEVLETEVAEQEETFGLRAAELYKRGATIPFAAVLESTSMADALSRGAYVQALNSADRASLEQIIVTRTKRDAERDRLRDGLVRLEEMKEETEEMLAEVEELRRHRALRLAEAGSAVRSLETKHGDLRADSERIERIIRQREREQARRAAGTPTQVSRSGFLWPRCDVVTSEYGMRWGRMHQGIDINGNTGNPIVASRGGTVIFAGWQGGYGRLVMIDHHNGVVTAYAHLSAFDVSRGATVSQGQLIGRVGSTGNSTGPHLHFETRVHGRAVNPRQFLPGSC